MHSNGAAFLSCVEKKGRQLLRGFTTHQELLFVSSNKLDFWAGPLGIINYDRIVFASVSCSPQILGQVAAHCLFSSFGIQVWNALLQSLLLSRKRTAHELHYSLAAILLMLGTQGLLLANDLCCGTQILLRMVSWKPCPPLSVYAIWLTLYFGFSIHLHTFPSTLHSHQT